MDLDVVHFSRIFDSGMQFGKPVTKEKHEGWHKVYLDGRAEALRVARAMGLWRLSGLRLTAIALMPNACGELDICVDTVNLQTIERKLEPASLELRAYLGNLTVPTPETAIELPATLLPATETTSAA